MTYESWSRRVQATLRVVRSHRFHSIFTFFLRVLSDGSLFVGPVDDKTYEGNYTCHVENIFGRDRISYALYVLHPPPPPEFHAEPVSSSAIRVQWKLVKQPDAVTTAYVLIYRAHGDQPRRIDVDSDRFSYTVDRLKCGTKYAVSMLTTNTVGTSRISGTEEVYTIGGGERRKTSIIYSDPRLL